MLTVDIEFADLVMAIVNYVMEDPTLNAKDAKPVTIKMETPVTDLAHITNGETMVEENVNHVTQPVDHVQEEPQPNVLPVTAQE